ncbi:hypothetical protein A9Q84_02485 [Halobacteriovorax marinus]|uniref:Uncharacterized protein n=1 Tax=Halobacteriovorax marinus TaxID=97084 RepID=A0A1Y5FJ86_9BACT|nr:hypothetical protein A9Q84_02485 [Halobacteriovorax marinus]
MKFLILFFYFSNSIASIDEVQFNQIAKKVMSSMKEEIIGSGMDISLNLDWNSTVVNAGANRRDNKGNINLHGAYARLAPVTTRSFAHTICHELGHLIAGGVKVMPTKKYSAEAEADYFATSVCLKRVFKSVNSNSFADLSIFQKSLCKDEYTASDELNLCAEILLASKEQSQVENFLLPSEAYTDFDQLNLSTTSITNFNGYPSISCRYTTSLYGALNKKRPACWFNKETILSNSNYVTQYRYYEAMFIGSVFNIKKTHYGCNFEVKSIDYLMGSYLSPLTEDDVEGFTIYKYGSCNFDNGSDLSGTLTLYEDELYFNLDSKDK